MQHSLSTTLRIAVVAACVGLCATPLMAQDMSGPPPGTPSDSGHHGMHRPHNPGAMLLKGITLTSSEQSQIGAIHTKYRATFDSLRSGGTKDWAGMRKIREAEVADIRNVLTSDQQAIFDQNVTTMKQRMQQMRNQHSGQPSN